MSISQDSAATIVCREVFDETSHPTNEELLDYAKRLGIDPDAEPHLLDLAREGLMAALPKGWSPCFHEASGAWYYYQASTGTTTWEHPLDAVYRGLVEQARTGNKRQMSLEEDSKTTAKDLESHEDATLPKETLKETATLKETTKETNHPKPGMVGTKIPMKLAPLRKIEKIDGSRRRDRPSSFDRLQSRRESDSRSDNIISLSSDRAARDYTNLKFQDPKFYECPKLLEKTDTIAATTTTTTVPAKKELDLKEVLKRSESLSPWHEKDWEQLSSKFSSEENIIDIDKLSASTLARPEKPEKFDKEKHPSQLGQQKELTLSGGGSMFLKSNRSRDNTPSQDGGKLEDFQALMISDEINNAAGDRLKSILREKQLDDDDRPLDEERKSVRFDLEKEINFNFTYSESEDDWESESEDKNPQISAVISNKITGSILSSRKPISQNSEDNNDDNKNDYPDEKDWDKMDSEINKQRLPLEKIEPMSKNAKIVGKRFLVQNVSENEHHTQMTGNSLEIDNSLDYLPNKLSEKVKNIDLVSKSETDCSTAKSSDSDEIRRTRSIIEKARHVTNRLSNWQLEDDESSDMSKVSHHYAQKERFVRPKLEYSRSIDDMKVKMNREHEKELEAFKIELEVKLQEKKKELEENFAQQKLLIQQYLDQRLEEVKQEMAQKEEQEIQALIAEMDQARIENLKKVRTELEACYEKERQEILANLKTELDERKKELLELRNQEMGKLENEHERDLGEEKLAKLNEYELRKQQTESIEILKKELEKELEDLRNELRMQQREKITKFTEDHEQCLAEILRDFRMDEALARKMYKERLEEIRADFARETEKEARKQTERVLQDSIDFEKMRCEKRLLQDKYTALKEKYMKLKNDVRLAVERRSRRKEGYTTASETERSTSTRTKTDRTESSEQNTPLKNANSSPVTNAKSQEGQNTSEQVGEQNDPDNSRSQRAAAGFQKRVTAVADSKSAAKFESDDTTTASETNTNMMMMKKKKSFSKKVAPSAGRSNGGSNNNPVENPVENIRKQLKKLEDLGDQLPSNETAYTVRYPFQDKAPANASSELEFFRHRIHVERDSVRRAREALRQQRSAFQGRQRAWKQRSARATLEQLVQEERELSDMEVSLHRTRSLLGEKVIHLKHLEQSLERVANDKRNENDASSIKNDELTLSDMSSASSGFSSTDLGTDTFIDKPDHYQESTEIIASLENLNSEIREIWDVLNKRQDSSNIPPTPALMYSYLRWLRFHHLTAQPNSMQGAFGTPNIQSNILSQLTVAQPPTTTTQNIIAQYGPNSGFTTSVGTVERNASNLMERTRNLRDWLRQARVENTDLISPGQATL